MKKKSRIKKFLDRNPKLKNPYFYISLIALIFASAGIDVETLTSWRTVGEALMNMLENPFILFCEIVAIMGVFNDNSTPGLDGLKNFKIKENNIQKPKDKL